VGRHYISADYFRTLGIPILAGRALTDADRAGRPPVTVINESAARQFWPGENPIGKRVWFGTTTGPFADRAHAVEVVGVAGDVKYEAVDWPGSIGRAEFYTSYHQFSFPDTMVIVKTRGEPRAAVSAMRSAIASVDPALPIYDVLPLDERVADALSRPRFNTAIVSALGAIAVVLAALGVYGLLSFSVASRVREIGIRVAIGAAPWDVTRLIGFEGLRLALAGIVCGLLATWVARQWLASFAFQVTPGSPRLLTIAALAVLATATAACALPARRAGATDPAIVLRSE
jgi:putative ABC transport system permease protein